MGDENTTYAKDYDSVELAYKPYEGDKDGSLQGASRIFPAICVTEKDFELWDCSNLIASGLPDNMYLTSNGNIEVKDLSKPVKAGEYKINLSGTTQLGKEFAATFKLILVDGIIVKGRMTDASGKAICNEGVYYQTEFYNGMRGRQIISYTDENGYYDIRLIPGKYSFATEIDNIYKSYNVDFSESQTYDMKSSCYKVVFANSIINKVAVRDEISSYLSRKNRVFDAKGYEYEVISHWDNYENSTYKFSLFTYVKKGTYNFGDGILKFDRFKTKENYKVLTEQFTISGACTVNIDLEKVE